MLLVRQHTVPSSSTSFSSVPHIGQVLDGWWCLPFCRAVWGLLHEVADTCPQQAGSHQLRYPTKSFDEREKHAVRPSVIMLSLMLNQQLLRLQLLGQGRHKRLTMLLATPSQPREPCCYS